MEHVAQGDHDPPSRPRTSYEQAVHALGVRLLCAQRPVRILEAVQWDAAVAEAFLSRNGREPPPVTPNYYANRPLRFDPEAKQREFSAIEDDCARRLGRCDPVGQLIRRRCDHYRGAVAMLARRGTPDFARLSRELYSQPRPGEDTAVDAVFGALARTAPRPHEREPAIDAAEAAPVLRERLRRALGHGVRVRLSATLMADAVACNNTIKLRRGAAFTPADLWLLEVHEGWVHVATSFNGRRQPHCPFLGSGPPATTLTQEGMAVGCEVLTGACHAGRALRLWRRYKAVRMAAEGADFRDVYCYFREAGDDMQASYQQAARVFRGSLPSGCGPFFKDWTYALGLVRVVRAVRAALNDGRLDRIALLFSGKTSLDESEFYDDLAADGLIQRPAFRPPVLGDPGAWSRVTQLLPSSTVRPPKAHFFSHSSHTPLVGPHANPLSFQETQAYSVQ